jgi:CHAT domain-containing protein
LQSGISSLPRSHHLRVPYVQALAIARLRRYTLSKQKEDLEKSILHHTEAIFLPLPWDKCCRNIIHIFFTTTLALLHRINETRQPEDVKYSLIYLRYLREESLKASNVPPNYITGWLVHLLASKVELELGDVMQDIEEMADLCHELLNSDTSIESLTIPVTDLTRTVGAKFGRWDVRQAPSEQVIECLREAATRLPDLDEVSITLARSLFNRFQMTYSSDDYEEGTAILDKIIAFCDPEDRPSQTREIALELVALFAQARSTMYGNPEYLEEAIYRFRTLLSKGSLENPCRPAIIRELARLQGMRFDEFGVTTGLQDVYASSSERPPHPSFNDLSLSLHRRNTDKYPDIQHLDALLSTYNITDVRDIEEAVEYCHRLLTFSHPSGEIAPLASIALGSLLLRAFLGSNKVEYLNNAISVLRDNLTILGVQQVQFAVVRRLISSLSVRLNLFNRRDDFDEIMQLFPIAVNNDCARILDRFLVSCHWAWAARFSRHSSTSRAYDCAISLMQETFESAPTLDTQYFRLAAMDDICKKLPLEYASYQVHTSQLKQAIESLERGRSLLWAEMRSFDVPLYEQLRVVDPHLADNFVAVNRELEMLTLTISPNINDSGVDDGLEGMDPFGRLVVRKRKLLDDRDKLILQIQALPGFEAFLTAPFFDNLRSAAAHGPVIIINHCRWRSDIIILLHNSPPSLITTSDDFYARAIKLQHQLLEARKEAPESHTYEDALRSVLKELYELVGRPVIQRLNELNVPEQSRVWWYPTSVFCSLPLHAMGPIPSDVGRSRYFLDLYIPSYIPSLSALIESHKPGPQTIGKPSILLVAQPEEQTPEALQEMKVVQAADTHVTTLLFAKATPTAVLKRLRDHPFVHIMCHGSLEPGKPFGASLILYRGERLSLLDIVRSRLPDAEFAFLSTCHSAELSEESIADEALHLSAAMQFCGFRSVIGTMWAMADMDGRHLARDFYDSVFSEWGHGGRYYERTAEALRDAVTKLRSKREMTLERWVNFVHYGA